MVEKTIEDNKINKTLNKILFILFLPLLLLLPFVKNNPDPLISEELVVENITTNEKQGDPLNSYPYRENSLTTNWDADGEFYSDFLHRKLENKEINDVNIWTEKLPTITFPSSHPVHSDKTINLTQMFIDANPYLTSNPILGVDEFIYEEVLSEIPFLEENSLYINHDFNSDTTKLSSERREFQISTTNNFDGIQSITFNQTDIFTPNPDPGPGGEPGEPIPTNDIEHGIYKRDDLQAILDTCLRSLCNSEKMPIGTWGWEYNGKESVSGDSIYNITVEYINPSFQSGAYDGVYVFEYSTSAKSQKLDQNVSLPNWEEDETWVKPKINNPKYNDINKEYEFELEIQTNNFPAWEWESFIQDMKFIDYPYWFNATTTESAKKHQTTDGVWDGDSNFMSPWIDVYVLEVENKQNPTSNTGDWQDELNITSFDLVHSEFVLDESVMSNSNVPSWPDGDVPDGTSLEQIEEYSSQTYKKDIVLKSPGDSSNPELGDYMFKGFGQETIIIDLNWFARYSNGMNGKTKLNYQNHFKTLTIEENKGVLPFSFNFSFDNSKLDVTHIDKNEYNYKFSILIEDAQQIKGSKLLYRFIYDEEKADEYTWNYIDAGNHSGNHISEGAYIIPENVVNGEEVEFDVNISSIRESFDYIQFGIENYNLLDDNPNNDEERKPFSHHEALVPTTQFNNSLIITGVSSEMLKSGEMTVTFTLYTSGLEGQKLWWKEPNITGHNGFVDAKNYGDEYPGYEINQISDEGIEKQETTIFIGKERLEGLVPGTTLVFTLGASEINGSEPDVDSISNNILVVLPEATASLLTKIMIICIVVASITIILFMISIKLWHIKSDENKKV